MNTKSYDMLSLNFDDNISLIKDYLLDKDCTDGECEEYKFGNRDCSDCYDDCGACDCDCSDCD